VARKEGEGTRGGFVWDGERLRLVDEVEISTGWAGDDQYHRSVEARLRDREGDEWQVTGKVLNLIPLRNRRRSPEGETMVTRISEGLTEWTMADGRTGYGLSEYLDQIIDGAPVGIGE
jgi:hypothetical protein